MTVKTLILDELGEARLALPELVNQGLVANDQVKVFFSVLQAARRKAEHPDEPVTDLRAECRAADLEDPAILAAIEGAHAVGDGRIAIPSATRLVERVLDGVATMLAPLQAEADDGDRRADEFSQRLERLREQAPDCEGDAVPTAWIGAATRGRSSEGDSLHVLVMDLHRELNRLQADVASESVGGALAYGLTDDDRRLVSAFMSGLASTAPLKFDHPGLDTTATRVGDRLVLQNDIGTTDAHVLVVHVEDRTVTVTYTDVHAPRAEFFRDLLSPCGLRWEDTRWRRAEQFEDGAYVLCTGRFAAADDEELERSLSFVGSRLVFLIDWNRARKQMRTLVRKRDAIHLLKQAADDGHGHRAFLQLGGAHLVHDALQQASPTALPLGRRLDELLGHATAMDFLRFVFRRTCTALKEGHSERLVRDELRAELLPRFHTAEQELLHLACRHAELVFELGTSVRESLVEAEVGGSEERLLALARRAARWEQEADALLREARDAVRGVAGSRAPLKVLAVSDDAADALEEVANLATLLPGVASGNGFGAGLRRLADLVLEACRDHVRCLECAVHVHRGGEREDLHDVLEAVDRLVGTEHRADDVLRELEARLVRESTDHRQLHLLSRIANELEEATDAIALCGHVLRDHALAELSQR